MDPAIESSDTPRRTSSPEASTRPNPFDDSDVASRKRRRTSLSGSPARSVDGSDPLHHDIESTDIQSADDETSDDAMKIDKPDNHSPSPKTPEHQTSSIHRVMDPPSSKVTINLRKNTHPNGSVPEDQPVPVVALDADLKSQQALFGDLAKDDLATVHANSRGSPSASLSSGSPAVELVTILDDEDDNLFSASVEDITLGGQDPYIPDPTEKFPYHESHEYRQDTVVRLVQYLTQTPVLDDAIIATTQTWLRDYLHFARHSPRAKLKQSLLAYRDMWARYPEVVLAMNNRKPPLQLEPEFRSVVLEYYADFIHLTAQLVSLDIATLQLSARQEAVTTSEKQYPTLFSGNFLQCVFLLTRREQQLDEDVAFPSSHGDKLLLLRKLEMIPEGNLDKHSELITLLLRALPIFPRLLGVLAYVASVLSNLLGAALHRSMHGSLDERLVATSQLERGHALWVEMTQTLDGLIDRSVSQLHSDSMSHITMALAGIYKACLRGSHQSAVQMKETYQYQHPDLSHEWVPEAMAHEWRFQVLGKLIRSSQMQLRVWAVTTMCNELVGVWKRFQDAPEHAILKHLAECLLRSALIEYILGPNCHPEIIAESANIVGFLVVTRTYQQQHTDRFWHNITCSQDPRVADALVRMIITIINIFDQSHLLDFCTKFQSLAADGFTMPMHKLWDAILNQLMDKAQKEQTVLTYPPYNLCLKLLREFSVLNQGTHATFPELQRVIMQKFKDLLIYGPDEEGRAMIYTSCVDDIANKSPTSLGSLWAILIAIGPAMERGISELTKDYGLPKLLIDEIEAAVESKTPQNPFPILWGSINHPRREMLLGIIQFQPDTLDEALGNKLWDILVGPRSPSPNDREAGWQILNEVVARSESKNPFTRTCLAHHLPRLPSHCFCVGLLDFVKQEVIKLMHVAPDFPLDDEMTVKSSCLEQLWTIILTADELSLTVQAIHFLAVEVYMSPAVVSRYPSPRLQQGHSILVNRCFSQLRDAAQHIRAASQASAPASDGETMADVDSNEPTARQERIFTRSLQLLKYFLEVYQARPELSTPDLRAVVSRAPSEVEGDPAQLKYQCFDGQQQTEMKPLSIGKLNTAASLLASLRQETGFQNYKAYFRGRPFHPDVRQLCKSLEDLQMHEGLILVKKAEERSNIGGCRVKLGSSALQIDILQHFDDLWHYLDLKESLASEIYQFLVKLPANYRILEMFEDETVSVNDIFPPGQPFKALYAAHALYEYKDLTSQNIRSDAPSIGPRLFPRRTAEEAKPSTISLIVQALPALQEPSHHSQPVQAKLVATMMHVLLQWLQDTDLSDPHVHVAASSYGITSPDLLINIWSRAAINPDDANFDVLLHTFEVILWLGLLDSDFWRSVTLHQHFFNTLRTLMLSEAKSTRLMVVEKIRDAVMRESSLGSRVSQQIAQYFWSLASQLVEDITSHPERCHDVFDLSYFILRDAHSRWRQDIDFTSLAAKFSDLLLNHTSSESINQATPQDPVAKNLADHLFLCLKADESIMESGSLSESLGFDIFWRHLFPAPRLAFEEPVPTVVLSQETRSQLSKIIFLLAKHNRRRLDQLLKDLASLVPVFTAEEDEPYLYELPQGFDRFRAIRSPCGYVGLRNLSNTCYLNSLLTQLYMNVPFRDFLLSSQVHDTGHSNSLLFQTKKLFGFLQESCRRFVDPTDMVMCIKTYEDTAIDIHNQMDVDEFYNLLFDRWESQLLNPMEKKKFRAFFGGQLVQQVKSQECEHISERLEPFSAIQCDIKGKTTLTESLQAYVDGEILDGDNKYKCSTCDRHVDAVKRACLKDIPDNVIFHLKRFDFNLRTLQRSKINDYFSFPAKINLAPYTVEHISGEVMEEDIFELVGVLVHAGTAESGHYYSYIRERPSSEGRHNWVEFNDDSVSTWDPSMMEASTFGGTNRPQPPDPSGVFYDKPYSAYMLFYQRSSALAHQGLELSQRGIPAPVHAPMDPELKEHILEENTQLLKRHCLFDPSHINLVRECFSHVRSMHAESKRSFDSEEEDTEACALMALAMEVMLGHFDQVICRTKDMPLFEDFEAIIKDAITTDSQCAFAFYDYFRERPVALRSLVQRNIEQRVRHSAGNLFLVALEKLSVHIPSVYDSVTEDTFEHQRKQREDFWHQRGCDPAEQPFVIQGVMRVLKHMWKGFPAHIRAWDEFFKMVLGFAKMGDRETAHLLADNFLLKLCRIIMADQGLELPGPYMRMLQNISRRFPNRPPSFQYIILTTEYLLHQLSPNLGSGTIVENPFERLDQEGAPFMWTSEEVATLHIHSSRRRDASFFVEKLVGHDQAVMASERILIRLMNANDMLDLNVVNSLVSCIRRDDSMNSLEPFLRMSVTYIVHTQHLDRALQLITHVVRQSSRLQVVESQTVLGFFKQVLALKRPDQDFVDQVRAHCIEAMPQWAPSLLVHYENGVRIGAADTIEYELFGGRTDLGHGGEDVSEDEKEAALRMIAQRLGIACLEHLRDTYVQSQTHIGRDQAQTIHKVITKCGQAFEVSGETAGDDRSAIFGMLRIEVIEQLRGLVVDDMEEEGSEWDASCVSSEQMDGIAEMSMQVMKELDDRDTT